MRPFATTLAAVLLFCATGEASAHAMLQAAVPAVGSTVPAPAEINLTFTERIEPTLCTIVVTDAGDSQVDRGDVHLAGAQTRLAVGLKSLAPGIYKVVWHAVSVDTHKTQGSFTFTVAP